MIYPAVLDKKLLNFFYFAKNQLKLDCLHKTQVWASCKPEVLCGHKAERGDQVKLNSVDTMMNVELEWRLERCCT